MTEPENHPQKAGGPIASAWQFGPEEHLISVRNAEAVLVHLPLFLGGWPMQGLGPAPEQPYDIDIVENSDGSMVIRLAGPGGNDMEMDDALDAANNFAGALIGAYIARQSDTICLHASTALVGGGLVVLVGDSFSGKSTTSLQLACAGYRFFGDDRIAIRWDDESLPIGQCLGLMPKMRLPLPPDCGAAFAEYIEGFSELQDEEAAYLRLGDQEAAGFGEEAPIKALIALDRRDTGDSIFEEAPRPQLVKSLLSQVYAPHLAISNLVPSMNRLASLVPCFTLRFSNSREAAQMIAARFRERPPETGNG
ncbi:MAG: hypothetical protein GKS01_08275 [Alphaproteobacteria bacterium]|nr:hypothetical protein [Alphaproteobacteria bacterium]